jgi:antitoxin component YwqK of YwqJK toxin-antitoxin module
MTKKPEIVKEDLIQKKNGLFYKENERVPFTGAKERFYENDQLKYKGNFKDGKQVGLWKFYYDAGQLLSKGAFKNGKPDGLIEEYYENGQLRQKKNFKDGQIADQLMELFYEDGRLLARENYKDGLKHGIYERYDFDKRKKSDSKRLEFRCNYKKGKLHGIGELFYSEGDQIICSRTTYQDGKRIEENKFHRNGLLKSKIIGDENYTEESYDEKGKFRSKYMFKNGKYFYDEDYKLIPKFIYKDGKIIDNFGRVLYPIFGRQSKNVRAKLSKLLKIF